MLYRPADPGRYPLVVFSHGRAGKYPPANPSLVYSYSQICEELAEQGCVVAYFVRRGYGNSEGPDSELQDTALLSGYEAAKDYAAAVEYWRTRDFVRPDHVVVMGQSQGGWAALASATLALPGVRGAVNISGGTNYAGMGTGMVTPAVQDAWVAGCVELGAGARMPTLWIYAENDLSVSGPTARRMFAAYTTAGGPATMLMLPPFGTNGHNIVGYPHLFIFELNEFFAQIGFGVNSAPVVGRPAGVTTMIRGGTATFTASVAGDPLPSLQWCKDGIDLTEGGSIHGSSSATLRVENVQMSDAGSYALRATNVAGATMSAALSLTVCERPVQVLEPPGEGTARIMNLSTRGIVAAGDHVLVAGFVIAGRAPKRLLILGSGLNLRQRFGLSGEVGRPRLTVWHRSGEANVVISQNDDWQADAAGLAALIAAVGAQPLSPSSDPAHGDAGLRLTLAPGVYTVVVDPAPQSATADGLGLVEIYDAAPETDSQLVNISSRGLTEAGTRQMIVGVVLGGSGSRRLLIRGVGPGLRPFGVGGWLSNPAQSLHWNQAGMDRVICSNDDWWNSSQAEQAMALMPALGAFGLDAFSTDAVVLQTLAAGAYTCVVTTVDGESGVVLTELYDADEH